MSANMPLTPPGMPPLSFMAPMGGGSGPRRGESTTMASASSAVQTAEIFEDNPSQQKMPEQLGVPRPDVPFSDEFTEKPKVVIPESTSSGPPNVETRFGDTWTVTRGPSGKLRSLNVTAGTSEPSDEAPGALEHTQSALRAVHGKMHTWVRGEVIGRGSLGMVFKALDQNTGKIFAAKEVLFNDSDEDDRLFKEALQNEIIICKDLSHPRIVSYLGHDSIDNYLYIYLEYMPGGSLATVLAQFGTLEEDLIAVYTQELLEGLEYLHSREPPVIHRDIKGANVLVGLDTQVKLADFGCSKRTNDTMSHTMKGSIPWMAPEVVSGAGYGRSADVWSLGCVVLEMASEARTPWGRTFDNPMAAMYKIAMSKDLPPIPECLTDSCKDFIRCCLHRNQAARSTAKQLLEHEFVKNILLDD